MLVYYLTLSRSLVLFQYTKLVYCYMLCAFPSSSTANKHFLRSMAHVGAGCVQFFDPKTKSKWERSVKAQLDKAFQPALTAVQVQWRQFDDDAPKPIQVAMQRPLVLALSP